MEKFNPQVKHSYEELVMRAQKFNTGPCAGMMFATLAVADRLDEILKVLKEMKEQRE